MTSRSITGRKDFSDHDMRDAKIASALEKLPTHVHFRSGVSVRGKFLKKTTDSYEEGRLLTRSTSIFETRAQKAVQVLSDLFKTKSLQKDDVQGEAEWCIQGHTAQREVFAVEEQQKLVKKSLDIGGEEKQVAEKKNKVRTVKNSLEVTNSSIKLTPR